MMTAPKTEPSLFTVRPVFGVAGGPDEIFLTGKGLDLSAKVATGLRPPAVAALAALAHGEKAIEEEAGAAVRATPFGLAHGAPEAIGVLTCRGLAELTFSHPRARSYRLTAAGRDALERIDEERLRLIARIRACDIVAV